MHDSIKTKNPMQAKTKWLLVSLFALGCISMLKSDTLRKTQ